MKNKKRGYLIPAILVLAFLSAPVLAKNKMPKGNQVPSIVDLSKLLPPPPDEDSEQGRAELAEVLRYQKTRTPSQVALAQADTQRDVFRFRDVFGEKFDGENLPLTAALFDKVVKISKAAVAGPKDFFDHPRPFVNHSEVTPCLVKENEGSYPSGHATFAAMTAVLLANMVPEKSKAIFQRAQQYSENRVLGGVHYPSDIEAGRISGTVIAAVLMKDKNFMKEFDAAKAELRKVLGY
jgi:acid phosphatase (class A)